MPRPWKVSPMMLGFALASGANAWAAGSQTQVTGVEVQAQAGASQVVIRTSRDPKFSAFKINAPTRVVIDLQETELGAVPENVPGAGAVLGVSCAQFSGSDMPLTRVVVTLSEGTSYDVEAQGAAVVLKAKGGSAPPQLEPAPVEPDTSVAALTEEPRAVGAAKQLLAIEPRENDAGATIKLRTDGEPMRYEIKEVDKPPRLVVDLYGVDTRLKQPREIQDDHLTRVRVGQHQDKTRVVVDTRGGVPSYNVATSEDGLTLVFSRQITSRGKARPAKPAATVDAVELTQQDGFYRLRLQVKGPFKERVASDAPRLKILELPARLPESLARAFEGPDAQGPVRRVATYVDPDDPSKVRVAVDLRSEVEHEVWRKGKELVWDFRPASKTEAPITVAAGFATEAANLSEVIAPAAKKFKGKRLTLNVKDADILNVLRLIADVSRLNVVASDDVKGKITIKLRDVPWDQALAVILKVKGLDMERHGDIIRVEPLVRLQEERKLKLERRKMEEESVPTKVKLLVVNYANAKEMLPQVQSLLSKRGSAAVDTRTNVIIVEDLQENVFQAERLVRTLDTQTPQVLIETRIIEASTNFIKDLGIQWGGGYTMSPYNGNPTGLIFPNMIGVAGGADELNRKIPGALQTPNFAVNYPAVAEGVGSTSVGLTMGSIGNAGVLNLRLSAAETEGQVRIVSAPKIVTIDNKPAKISQGVDIPVQTFTQTSVVMQIITAALELEVTPHVTTDASILMKIRLSNNTPTTREVKGIPTIEKKEADTEVLLRDGETSVIGGIYTRRVIDAYQGTPLLGRIPLLGWLFKNESTTDERKELLAFITPTIINRQRAIVSQE